jgi:hypothetical protein
MIESLAMEKNIGQHSSTADNVVPESSAVTNTYKYSSLVESDTLESSFIEDPRHHSSAADSVASESSAAENSDQSSSLAVSGKVESCVTDNIGQDSSAADSVALVSSADKNADQHSSLAESGKLESSVIDDIGNHSYAADSVAHSSPADSVAHSSPAVSVSPELFTAENIGQCSSPECSDTPYTGPLVMFCSKRVTRLPLLEKPFSHVDLLRFLQNLMHGLHKNKDQMYRYLTGLQLHQGKYKPIFPDINAATSDRGRFNICDLMILSPALGWRNFAIPGRF